MKTRVKITPEHFESGLRVQYFCIDDWINYNGDCLYETEAEADAYIRRVAMRSEAARREKFRAIPNTILIPAWPSLDYIEELWLAGYQGARRGEANRYGEPEEGESYCPNFALWNEGAEAFRAGKKLFT